MKDRIKAWLKSHDRDREWLAEQVGVTKKTIDNWLSSPQEIPIPKLRLIERLMQEDAAAEALRRLALLPQSQIFSLEVDLPTFRSYSAACRNAGQTLEAWAIDELNAAAAVDQALKPQLKPTCPHQPDTAKVAKDSPNYGQNAKVSQEAGEKDL